MSMSHVTALVRDLAKANETLSYCSLHSPIFWLQEVFQMVGWKISSIFCQTQLSNDNWFVRETI